MFDTSSILIKKFDGQMFDGMFNNVAQERDISKRNKNSSIDRLFKILNFKN